MESLQPAKKRQNKVDFGLCFICQTKTNAPITEKPAVENVEKFMNAAKEKTHTAKLNTQSLLNDFLSCLEKI